METKFRIPVKRTYRAKAKNETVSIRIPDTLKKELETLASELGLGFSELIQDGLDQYAAHVRSSLKKK